MTVWVNLGCMPLGLYYFVVVTMPYGCMTMNLAVTHLAILRTAHDRWLVRYIAQKIKRRDGCHMLSCADALVKTGCENVETTVRKRRIVFSGFMARMGNERLPKRVMCGKVDGGTVLGRARTGPGGLSGTRSTWYRCSTCPSKRNNEYWQHIIRAGGLAVMRKRLCSLCSADSLRRRSKWLNDKRLRYKLRGTQDFVEPKARGREEGNNSSYS